MDALDKIPTMVPACDGCGTTDNVDHVIDPYDQDVNNRTTFVWLCDPCWRTRADDI